MEYEYNRKILIPHINIILTKLWHLDQSTNFTKSFSIVVFPFPAIFRLSIVLFTFSLKWNSAHLTEHSAYKSIVGPFMQFIPEQLYLGEESAGIQMKEEILKYFKASFRFSRVNKIQRSPIKSVHAEAMYPKNFSLRRAGGIFFKSRLSWLRPSTTNVAHENNMSYTANTKYNHPVWRLPKAVWKKSFSSSGWTSACR